METLRECLPLYVYLFVEEFDGKTATVTFKFVDDTNGSELADSYAVKNREGQQYYTPEIPSIENYELVLDSLPNNGAGKVGSKDITVEYKYTRVTGDSDKSECKVNIIYIEWTRERLLKPKPLPARRERPMTHRLMSMRI